MRFLFAGLLMLLVAAPGCGVKTDPVPYVQTEKAAEKKEKQ